MHSLQCVCTNVYFIVYVCKMFCAARPNFKVQGSSCNGDRPFYSFLLFFPS